MNLRGRHCERDLRDELVTMLLAGHETTGTGLAWAFERILERQPDPWEWTAFGGGVRRCLGMVFALFEMKVITATVLSMTRLRLAVPKVEVARRGFFLAPEGGPPVIVESRTPLAA